MIMTTMIVVMATTIFFLQIDRYYDITGGILKMTGFKIPPLPIIIWTR
jgi:hypothetical protein